MDENKSLTPESAGEDADRPPADPRNKLYTVISLLIFAVIYIAVQLIKQNFTAAYALYDDSPSVQTRTAALREIGMETLPDGFTVEYIRLHRNFDSNTLYIALSLPEDISDAEEFAEGYIPYEWGNVVSDERFTIYPDPDMTAEYVYGDSYVCVDDPLKSCLIYESDGVLTAVFRTDDYDQRVRTAMGEGIRINVK